MLVLGRKVGEVLVIGNDTVVTVVSVRGGRVRLGVRAPGEVPVLRGELGPFVADDPGRESAGSGWGGPGSPEADRPGADRPRARAK
jgi:carbon storage regulator